MSMNAKNPLPSNTDDFMSTADAAKLLFVSRPHILKLLEQGKIKLHHMMGNQRFVEKASVLALQAEQRAAVKAYQDSAAGEE
ncbi:helix-turn-helix domain-containing protein [Burkholderia stabilis]|uniref:helix-turn-helix domain-containing protein n=1 Tax=Burkholderia stabilis TaxID=95485 RepID=UPI001F4A13DE|nr:helix-turn-helix domain-containing protein [Burkholderia stabilis]